MAPKLLGGASTFLLNIILFRFFSPEQYGAYAICISVIVLAEGNFGSAIDLAVLRLAPLCRTDDPSRSRAIQQAGLYIKLVLIGVVFLFLWLFAVPLQRMLFSNKGEVSWLHWTTAVILGVLSLRSVQTHFQVEGKFSAYGKLELLHIFSKFTGVAIAVVMGRVNLGLILAFFAAAPISLCIFFFVISGKDFFRGRNLLSIQLIKQMVHFMKWFLVTTGISVLVAQLPNFTLTRWAGIREVGIYSAGSALSSIFPMLGLYLSVLLSPRIMSFCRQGTIYSLYRVLQRILIAASGVIYLFFFLSIDLIARKLFPSSFAQSKTIFMILLPAALSWLATTPLNMTFVMFIRPKFIVFMETILFPFLILSFYLVIPGHGAVGAAWVAMVFGLIRSGSIQVAAWIWVRRFPVAADSRLNAPEDSLVATSLPEKFGW
ncbi:MAG TPA: oligosaccharide flippase family protein [Terriglobia bacterium]|nr:oligosaccharide flippase family protein [Terriglobia bacterium]